MAVKSFIGFAPGVKLKWQNTSFQPTREMDVSNMIDAPGGNLIKLIFFDTEGLQKYAWALLS